MITTPVSLLSETVLCCRSSHLQHWEDLLPFPGNNLEEAFDGCESLSESRWLIEAGTMVVFSFYVKCSSAQLQLTDSSGRSLRHTSFNPARTQRASGSYWLFQSPD